MKILTKLLFVISIFTITLNANTLNPSAVIDKMIQAYGGEKNLQQLNAYQQVWHIETKTSKKNGTDYRKVALPDFLRTELVYPDKTEIRVLIKDYGTKQFGQRKIQAQGPMLDAMKLQLMRLYTPLTFKKMINKISMQEDKENYILTIDKGAISAKYFVSKKSFFIDKVVGNLKIGTKGMAFLTIYKDYKPEHGVMLPHTEVKFAGGINTAVMTLEVMKFVRAPKAHR